MNEGSHWLGSTEYQFLHKELKVTMRDYADAIDVLYEHACSDHELSRLAANVLLSAYNSSLYPLELAPLFNSEETFLNQVLIIIRGRSTLKMEPHHAIKRGPQKFDRLKSEWLELLSEPCPDIEEEGRDD